MERHGKLCKPKGSSIKGKELISIEIKVPPHSDNLKKAGLQNGEYLAYNTHSIPEPVFCTHLKNLCNIVSFM